MSKKLKRKIIRVAAGAGVYAVAVVLDLVLEHLALQGLWVTLTVLSLYVAAYLVVGFNVLHSAVLNIARARFLDENFLMVVASLGAFFVGESREAVAVMLFYQVGECFQSYAVGRSRKSISALMNIRPDSASVVRGGETLVVNPSEVAVGETIVVKPGELVPLDGILLTGDTSLDTKALTGESLPRSATVGDSVLSGSVNLTGLITLQVISEYGASTVAKILDLVENQTTKKAKAENFITKFSRVYTPVVVGLAVLLAVLPPLFLGIGDWSVWSQWIYRALTFLVVSCPCALVISIPLSFFGGLGGASRRGILVKGANYLEVLSKTGTVVLDKTGTITKGEFSVTKVLPQGVSDSELLETLALAESASTHPIAQSILSACGSVDRTLVENITEVSGKGVKAVVSGKTVLAGNAKLLENEGVPFTPCTEIGTVVYCAVEGAYTGCVVISDTVKEDSKVAIAALKNLGVSRVVMLTGDAHPVAEDIATQVGITDFKAELLPADKVSAVEELLATKEQGKSLAFVGDGINDAPVLAGADVGIAMGGIGSDAAIEAADVVLMNDDLSSIATAVRIARRTLRIVKQNIVFAIGVKVLILLLAALGLAGMWAAVFGDVGVAVLAILNAMRCLSTNKIK